MSLARFKGKRVFIIGNGGSFANASHIANDFLLKGVAAFTLDPAFLTATANDFAYDQIFVRWLKVVSTAKDILIALSGSGTSPNIVNAVTWAEDEGLEVIKVYGADVGLGMQDAEEEQLNWGHSICFPKT